MFDGGAYNQVVGTSQYRLPDTRKKLKAELEAMWADRYVAMPPMPDEGRMAETQNASLDAMMEAKARREEMDRTMRGARIEDVAKG